MGRDVADDGQGDAIVDELPHELAGQAGGLRGGGFGDEDDVDVGDVVEFPGAALAHGHDGQACVDALLLPVDARHGEGESGGERGIS